jgi:hypothetical protein
MDAWHLILTARLLDLQCSELSEREEETRRLSLFVMVNQDEQTPNNIYVLAPRSSAPLSYLVCGHVVPSAILPDEPLISSISAVALPL